MTIDLELGVPARRPDLWEGLVVAAPTPVGQSADGPPPPGVPDAGRPDELCVELVHATHGGTGGAAALEVGCRSSDDVARVLTAAVAALTGEDVRAAFDAPDLDRVVAPGRGAREAIRDVVAHVVVPAAEREAVLAGLPPQAREGSAGRG